MNLQNILFAIFAFSFKFISAHEAKDFDDSILYKIDFELPPDLDNEDFYSKYQISTFHTHDHEEYKCAIPIAEENREEKNLKETVLTPLQLINPLFSSIRCSYRIEAYWSYEICHGYHIKQYHEEREGKSVKFQEYYLGRWSDEKQLKLAKKILQDDIKYNTTKIDNVQYPYLEFDMDNGTLCDLNNEPRTTKIRYVCYPHGKNAIYSFKETSTCNYEAIILTSTLCLHPAFLPEKSKEIPIKCFNSPTVARKPLSLLKQNLEDFQMVDLNKIAVLGNSEMVDVVDLHKILEGMVSKSLVVSEDITVSPSESIGEEIDVPKKKLDFSREEYESLYDFLFENCLFGGTGWWKYEFCFGRHVRQFHKDKEFETQVMLGFFWKDLHRDWLKANPTKRLRRNSNEPVTTLWNHYGTGTRCDKTNKPREIDVKLMCVPSSSTSSVSMYLLEPKTCQYILVVESPMICLLIQMVDDDGLITKSDFIKHVNSLMEKPKDITESFAKKSEEKEDSVTAVTDHAPTEEGPTAVFGL